MRSIIPLQEITEADREQVGGKAFSLATLGRMGMNVPDALCVTAEVYNRFITLTHLRERILLELNRKSFREMRWEEMWDAALRIRNMFLTASLPHEIDAELRPRIEDRFKDEAVVVRSSAPGEDSSNTSFAGLHESYVNIRGVQPILEHIRLVWASLWSDGALLYRQELGLDFEKNSMAVLVQKIVPGERSGVVFGKNPNDGTQAVIEAVYGLNMGLVDGTVEPDRWILNRETGKILSRSSSRREKRMMTTAEGTILEALPSQWANMPPVTDPEVSEIFALALETENQFKTAQDVEWTIRENRLYLLQSRPITTVRSESPADKRPWYLSLRRSFENLKILRKKIEDELIPAMIDEAERLALIDFAQLSDVQLAGEISGRSDIHGRWVGIYWSDFIPFAHGMRLFGQFYNDSVRPDDPYEFMDLLGSGQLKSLKRNRLLEEMAFTIGQNPALARKLRDPDGDGIGSIERALNDFMREFGDLSCSVTGEMECLQGREGIIRLLLEMASHPVHQTRFNSSRTEHLESEFLSRFKDKRKDFAAELLDLGRVSYRLRDDDNIYLGNIERQLVLAVEEGKRRLENQGRMKGGSIDPAEVIKALRNPRFVPKERSLVEKIKPPSELKARQMVGQPAGPGVAKGRARVIEGPHDLPAFKSGEILVCDAVEPNMTFVIPLCSGIVERRGGMLIHGAIIAREYGLPCVTGVPDATTMIHTGDSIMVDGYLGIVVIE